ncbi:MAG: insulinase family protein, partial [Polyangiaceae bacterium]|nr:insulinase family protein [Polyangiaceae bacterium]
MKRPLLRRLAGSILAGALCWISAPAAAEVQPLIVHAPLTIERVTLPNGLIAILHQDHRAAVVAVQVHFRVGSKDDPVGRRGMASLMRHILSDGSTRHVPADGRAELIRTLGAEPWSPAIDARTDTTKISFTVPAQALDLALWLEADRLGFAADAVDTEAIADARRQMEEQAQRDADAPYSGVQAEVLRALFGAGHPYVVEAPRPGELSAVTPAEVLARLRAWYGPANAVLSISGDFSITRAKELVARRFGSLAGGPRPQPTPIPAPALQGERRIRIEAGVGEARAVLAWATPPIYQKDDALLDVVATILRARLQGRLGGDSGIAGDCFVRQMSNDRGSRFMVSVT